MFLYLALAQSIVHMVRILPGRVKATSQLISDAFTHAEADCRTDRCAECKYRRMRKVWHARCTLGPEHPVTWLASQITHGDWGVGCAVCNGCNLPGVLAQFGVNSAISMQSCCFEKHGHLGSHKRAVATLLNKTEAENPAAVPTTEQFQKVWESARYQGQSQRVENVGCRAKVKKMVWVLAEAIRDLHREALSRACTLSIFQDVRKHRLVTRFCAADENMQVRRGILGLEKDFASGHEGVLAATKAIFQRFCCLRVNRPFKGQGRRPAKALGKPTVHDDGAPGQDCPELYEHARRIAELYCSDAAGDENLAGKKMRGNHFLPNLQAVTRDKCHGVRRVTSRPWAADAVLQEVVDGFVFGDKSITSLIQHSGDFRLWFQRSREGMEQRIGACIKSLSLAKHRFDSTQKPLARAVLSLPALIETASKIDTIRKGDADAVHANVFLRWVDMSKALLLAMLADAGDEAIQLVRVFDDERADACEIAHVCSQFVRNIKYLFCDAGCVTCGYTKFMLDLLKKPMVYSLQGGRAYSLGAPAGVPDGVLLKALTHMNTWVRLAISVLQGECPAFEMVQSFGVFNLVKPDGQRRHWQESLRLASASGAKTSLCQLASFFKLDYSQVVSQFQDLQEIAYSTLVTEPGLDHREAWRRALAKVKQRWNRTNHPCDAISVILARWTACVISTSGLEQGFSRMDKIFGKSRLHMSRQAEQDHMTLVIDYAAEDEASVLSHFTGTGHLEGALRLGPQAHEAERCERPSPRQGNTAKQRGRVHCETQADGTTVREHAAWNRERRACAADFSKLD